MKHARADYDSIQPFPTKRPHIVRIDGKVVDAEEGQYLGKYMDPIIPDDEPVLLIRAQDLCAVPVGLAWIEHAERLGVDPALIAAMDRHVEEIRRWQETVAAKVPDAPLEALR